MCRRSKTLEGKFAYRRAKENIPIGTMQSCSFSNPKGDVCECSGNTINSVNVKGYFQVRANLPINRDDLIYDLLHFTGQDFTAAQRERAQEDFKVLFKGAPPHPPSHSHTKDSHSTGITLLFSNSAWVLLRPTELSTFKEL